MKLRVYFGIIVALVILPAACFAADIFQREQSTQPKVVFSDSDSAEAPKIESKTEAVLTPQEAEAEKVRKAESDYQTHLTNVGRAVDDLEKRLGEFRKQAIAPAQMDIERFEHDLSFLDQDLSRMPLTNPSPLVRVQRSDLQDRVFQMQVATEIMKRRWEGGWKVFGMDFFNTIPPEMGSDYGPVPANYKVRIGDQLHVIVSSRLGAESDYSPTVDSNGKVYVPGAGSMSVIGRTASQIRQAIADKVQTRFKQLNVSVSVMKLQSVRVQVTGEVARPGTYSLTGMATVLTALYQAGGPTKTGSFRKIRLVRSGSPDRSVDLYDLLVNGSRKGDYALIDGDLIFVPPVGGTVVLEGEVVRPARYEPDFPLTLAQALKLAGNAKPGAYVQSVQVERVENGENRLLLSEALSNTGSKSGFALRPGDQVTVVSVRPDRTNQVEVRGPVAMPGLYGFRTGMKVSDLIKVAQGLAQGKEVYGQRADILRMDPLEGSRIITLDLAKALAGDVSQDMQLQKLDRLFLYEPDQIIFRPKVVAVKGAVAKPGAYRRTDGMCVRDAIAAAGGVLPNAYLVRADILHTAEDGSTELARVDLRAALSGAPDANCALRDRDAVTVYTQEEAQWSDRTVRIEGAVQRPGVYARSNNMRVSDLLFACGGLLPEADGNAELAHNSGGGDSTVTPIALASLAAGGGSDPLLLDRDVVTVPSTNPSLRAPEVVYITGEVARPGPYTLTNRNEKLTDLVARAGGLTRDADARGMLFLRQKESFENEQQGTDADLILQKSRAFADKQFLTHLAKLGVGLPGQFIQAIQQSSEKLAKPVEVVADKKLQEGPGTEGTTSGEKNVDSNPDLDLETPDNGIDKEAPVTTALGPKVEATDEVGLSKTFTGRQELAALENSARISVSLTRAFGDTNSPDNIPMRQGDRVFIPKITNVVTVIGAVLHPHSFAAGPGKSPDYYIQRSGGFAQDASKSNVVVVRSNGDALPKDQAGSAEPGDMIVVPTTGLIDIAKKWERIGPVAQVLSNVLSSVYVLTKL